jgi:hypothetical protein
MNGFSYDEREKKIRITDGTSMVVWENVDGDVAIKAASKFNMGENIDNFLIERNCKRSWGTNVEHN